MIHTHIIKCGSRSKCSYVSMGLGPIMSIYQARFTKYLINRGLLKDEGRKIWTFLGDGETDEPESLGAIGLASREKIGQSCICYQL